MATTLTRRGRIRCGTIGAICDDYSFRLIKPRVLQLLLSFVILIGWAARLEAHLDNPDAKVGEYRVTLNSVTIKAFSSGGIFGDINPDVIIKTFTQAGTHEGQTALFGPFDYVGYGTTFPQDIGIGKLIYWHVDCTPSENLQLILDSVEVLSSFLTMVGP